MNGKDRGGRGGKGEFLLAKKTGFDDEKNCELKVFGEW